MHIDKKYQITLLQNFLMVDMLNFADSLLEEGETAHSDTWECTEINSLKGGEGQTHRTHASLREVDPAGCNDWVIHSRPNP